jgi:hypothetical protein
MAPTILTTTRELPDAVGDAVELDLVAALAFPLPANTSFPMPSGSPKTSAPHANPPRNMSGDRWQFSYE